MTELEAVDSSQPLLLPRGSADRMAWVSDILVHVVKSLAGGEKEDNHATAL